MYLKNTTLYILTGLVLGIAPPLIALHLLQEYQPISSELHHTRQSRELHLGNHDKRGDYKVFDKAISDGSHRAHGKQQRHYKKSRNTLEALASVNGLRFTKKLFAAVLSEEAHETKMSAAVGMTWGSDVIDFEFMYATQDDNVFPHKSTNHQNKEKVPVPVKDAYGEEHFLHSLRHTCQNLKEDYRWYMVVKDTMYINSEEILAFLDTLYHADDFVFGKEDEEACHFDQGIILSKQSHQKFCQNQEKCSAGESFAECLALATETKCIDLAKASGTLRIDEEEMKNQATIKLSRKVLVYPNMKTPQDMYGLHLQAINMKISKTSEKLSLLRNSLGGQQRSKIVEEPTAFLKNWKGNLDKNKLNATRPTHQMIESNGALVSSTCQNSNTKDIMPYRAAQQYADDIVGAAEKNLKTFGYRRGVTAFHMTHEFYYTSPKMGRQHVHHVTVSQNYSVLKMLSSEVYSMRNISILTEVSSSGDERFLYGYLDHLQEACANLSAFKVVCEVFVLFNESHSSSSANISHVKTVLNNFITEQQEDGLTVLHVKLLHANINDSLSNLILGEVVQQNLITHTPVHSRFDHEYLLRCHINSQPLNVIYYPAPFQLYKTVPDSVKTFSASDGYWLSNDYRTYCVTPSAVSSLSLNLVDIQYGVNANIQGDLQINRYPDPGLLYFPYFTM